LLINRLQLRASQATGDLSDTAGKRAQRTERNIRLGLCGQLVQEARKVVSLEKCLGVVGAACKVGYVDGSEGVGLAGVTGV